MLGKVRAAKSALSSSPDVTSVKPEDAVKRRRDVGRGRYIILCDEENCPLASDINLGREYCVFHFSAKGAERRFVTKWLRDCYALVQLAKLYDRYGVLDDARHDVLAAFNRVSVSLGYDELPPEEHPYFIRPINYCLAACKLFAEAKVKEEEEKGYGKTRAADPKREVRGLIQRALRATPPEDFEEEKWP